MSRADVAALTEQILDLCISRSELCPTAARLLSITAQTLLDLHGRAEAPSPSPKRAAIPRPKVSHRTPRTYPPPILDVPTAAAPPGLSLPLPVPPPPPPPPVPARLPPLHPGSNSGSMASGASDSEDGYASFLVWRQHRKERKAEKRRLASMAPGFPSTSSSENPGLTDSSIPPPSRPVMIRRPSQAPLPVPAPPPAPLPPPLFFSTPAPLPPAYPSLPTGAPSYPTPPAPFGQPLSPVPSHPSPAPTPGRRIGFVFDDQAVVAERQAARLRWVAELARPATLESILFTSPFLAFFLHTLLFAECPSCGEAASPRWLHLSVYIVLRRG